MFRLFKKSSNLSKTKNNCLGSVALKNVLGKEYGITASRGKWLERKGILYMPTWHPAALLRDENKKIDFIKDLKQVIKRYNEICQ